MIQKSDLESFKSLHAILGEFITFAESSSALELKFSRTSLKINSTSNDLEKLASNVIGEAVKKASNEYYQALSQNVVESMLNCLNVTVVATRASFIKSMLHLDLMPQSK